MLAFKDLESYDKEAFYREFLKVMSQEKVYFTFKAIIDNDCYYQEFCDSEVLETFLSFMLQYGFVWIASDNRVLLTDKGNLLIQYIDSTVDFSKKSSKVKKKSIWKTKTQK